MTKQHKLLSLAACMSAALVASSAMAAETPAAQTSAKEVLPRTLEGYVSQDKAFWDYLKANHPYFKYLKEGRVVGKFTMSDREEEWVDFGGGDKYREDTGRTTAVTYRLPYESFLDLPNNFVGPKKCGECHPSQYEKWERSRHNKIVRFPEEMTEAVVQGDLKRPLYGSKASVLPEGINVEDVYVLMGTPRTKYGFVDKWLVRGTYHIEDGGSLSQATGKIVAGGNQFSRNWAEHITPEVAKKINAWDPTFPTKLEDFGAQSSKVWGMNSYGASNRKQAMFQPGSSYCEICHTWKFDFKSQDELFAALGDGEKLRAHTIAKGVSCEECHGAGAHLYGARGAGMPSDCERCHQRFVYNREDAKANPKAPFTSYFKSFCPACGTEGSQSHYTKHYQKGMRCTTCHDPHEVTSNDWTSQYTVPNLKKNCQDCHTTAAYFFSQGGTHSRNSCESCHMPKMGSCENFAAIQRPDMAGFDNVRASHIWRILVDPEKKSINPPEGADRKLVSPKGWHLTKDEGRPYLDLMWTCGRTAYQDKHVVDAMGCHSPIQSKFPEMMRFKDQKTIYNKVIAWQTPVKEGYAKVIADMASIQDLLKVTNLSTADRAQVQLYAEEARLNAAKIKDDGSWGVHAPKFAKQLVDEATTYTTQALAILNAANKTAKK